MQKGSVKATRQDNHLHTSCVAASEAKDAGMDVA